ncbi:rhodanese-like domain-containing protein [Bacillus sp. REN3]|uniref:rhodanese-like domain-containing protein n=1 Tax=Bacillus sp. REN3 TaxID=2802440 RepID=UPI001AEDFFF0|nr:rhodanese-like domain-containing protein [Bacillus sp. REN3]
MRNIETITTDEVQKRIEAGEKLELVDVREHDEVEAGMIPGAKHIPMGEIPERLNEFDKEKEYIFVCRSSARSGNVCYYLSDQGFKVKNMVGGMLDWKGETTRP